MTASQPPRTTTWRVNAVTIAFVVSTAPRIPCQLSVAEPESPVINGSLAALDDTNRDVQIAAVRYFAETVEKIAPADVSAAIRRIKNFSGDASPGIVALSGRAYANIWAKTQSLDVRADELKELAQRMSAFLSHSNATVRQDALTALGSLGAHAIDEVAKIIPLLDSFEDSPAAVETLTKMGSASPDAVTKLAEKIATRMKTSRVESRQAELNVLAALGPAANIYAGEISNLAGSADEVTLVSALNALAAIGPGPTFDLRKFEQTVTGYLTDEHQPTDVRAAAANAVGTAAALSGSFKCNIAQVLATPHDDIRSHLIQAILAAPKAAAPQFQQITALLESSDKKTKTHALAALGAIEPIGKYVPALVELLKSADDAERGSATAALATLKDVIKDRIALIGDLLAFNAPKPEYQTAVRSAALSVLAQLGASSRSYLPQICGLLEDRNPPEVRVAAMRCVAALKEATPNGMQILCRSLMARNGYETEAMKAMARSGPPAKGCATQISTLLLEGRGNLTPVATRTLFSLGVLDGDSIANVLLAAQQFQQLREEGRAVELQFLAHRAGGGNPKMEFLIAWLGISRPHPTQISRTEAVALLNAFEEGWNYAPTSRKWKAQLAETTASVIGRTRWGFQLQKSDVGILRKHSGYLRAENQSAADGVDQLVRRASQKPVLTFVREHSYMAVPLAYVLALLGIYRVRPLFLLTLNNAGTKRLIDVLPAWLGGKAIKVFQALLLTLLYRPRVLDAWVEKQAAGARERFDKKDTVRARRVHVSLPLVVNGELVPDFRPRTLARAFAQNLVRILIFGEGGSGKTSLACHIAQAGLAEDAEQRPAPHRIIPILIDTELGPTEAERNRLFETIRRQLQELVGQSDPIPPELTENLLRRRRLLVIIDHFSEMSEATRKAIDFTAADFPVNCLIVTSRTQEKLFENDVVLTPVRIEGRRLSSFVDAYLIRRNKRELFVDVEFFEVCRRLAELVGDRQITVLLAKLYVEYVIAAKERPAVEANVGNIPDLMLSYLSAVNSGIEEETRRSNRDVQEDAMAIAWECLRVRLQPELANRPDVVTALGGDGIDERLEYLEKKLNVIQTVGAGENYIRFALDPLAEYLAALRLMQNLGSDDNKWKDFLARIELIEGIPVGTAAEHEVASREGGQASVTTVEYKQASRGFLQALYDCNMGNSLGLTAPELVKAALTNFLQQVRQI